MPICGESLIISLQGTGTIYAWKDGRSTTKIDPTNVKLSLEDYRTHHENSNCCGSQLGGSCIQYLWESFSCSLYHIAYLHRHINEIRNQGCQLSELSNPLI